MTESGLSAAYFNSEAAAFAFIEKRIWPDEPVCPHCGCDERIGKLNGRSYRMGLYKCYECRKPFTVRIGTLFQDSHAALNVWLQAIYLMTASKKGIRSSQLHRVLGVTPKTAGLMSHRIRAALGEQTAEKPEIAGGSGDAFEEALGRIVKSSKIHCRRWR
jgi:transposase-like protein